MGELLPVKVEHFLRLLWLGPKGSKGHSQALGLFSPRCDFKELPNGIQSPSRVLRAFRRPEQSLQVRRRLFSLQLQCTDCVNIDETHLVAWVLQALTKFRERFRACVGKSF